LNLKVVFLVNKYGIILLAFVNVFMMGKLSNEDKMHI